MCETNSTLHFKCQFVCFLTTLLSDNITSIGHSHQELVSTGEVTISKRRHISLSLTCFSIIAETVRLILDYYSAHALCRCLLQLIHPVTLSSPCLSVLSFVSLKAWYIKPALFAPLLSFRHSSVLHGSTLGTWIWHAPIFTNSFLHRQALITVIIYTNAKSCTQRCFSLPVPSFSFHMHASADVITVSAASAARRCETKSCSPPLIIKSFLAIGQLTLASRTVLFHFHQSRHPYSKRGKDCQMISACFHHRQREMMWNSERKPETLLYIISFCEVAQPCWKPEAI